MSETTSFTLRLSEIVVAGMVLYIASTNGVPSFAAIPWVLLLSGVVHYRRFTAVDNSLSRLKRLQRRRRGAKKLFAYCFATVVLGGILLVAVIRDATFVAPNGEQTRLLFVALGALLSPIFVLYEFDKRLAYDSSGRDALRATLWSMSARVPYLVLIGLFFYALTDPSISFVLFAAGVFVPIFVSLAYVGLTTAQGPANSAL